MYYIVTQDSWVGIFPGSRKTSSEGSSASAEEQKNTTPRIEFQPLGIEPCTGMHRTAQKIGSRAEGVLEVEKHHIIISYHSELLLWHEIE